MFRTVVGHRTNNLEDNISNAEALALFLFPARDAALRHGGTHRRHGELGERVAAGRDMEA